LFRNFLAARSQGQLSAVDVRARADGWAVGTRCTGRCQDQYTLIERWNGRRWSRVPSPNASRIQVLESVRTVSAGDAWAVGFYATNRDEAIRTLIEHWNGRRWSRVPSPNPSAGPSGLSALSGVTAVSARDAWAAGFYAHGSTAVRPLFLRWNGRRWSVVPSPHKSSVGILMSVSAMSARSAWAVGTYGYTGLFMLLMHWNGVRWSVVPGVRVQGELESVSAVSARDAWAAGLSCPGHCDQSQPPVRALLLHWNGVRWARAAIPEPGTGSALADVSAASAADGWAVGAYCQKRCGSPTLNGTLLLLRWNGIRWVQVAGPELGPGVADLGGVSALSARQAWAAGLRCAKTCYRQGAVVRPLIMRWNGLRWAS
jgi:hypothetical protein